MTLRAQCKKETRRTALGYPIALYPHSLQSPQVHMRHLGKR